MLLPVLLGVVTAGAAGSVSCCQLNMRPQLHKTICDETTTGFLVGASEHRAIKFQQQLVAVVANCSAGPPVQVALPPA